MLAPFVMIIRFTACPSHKRYPSDRIDLSAYGQKPSKVRSETRLQGPTITVCNYCGSTDHTPQSLNVSTIARTVHVLILAGWYVASSLCSPLPVPCIGTMVSDRVVLANEGNLGKGDWQDGYISRYVNISRSGRRLVTT
jgi:hypothetical protein